MKQVRFTVQEIWYKDVLLWNKVDDVVNVSQSGSRYFVVRHVESH